MHFFYLRCMEEILNLNVLESNEKAQLRHLSHFYNTVSETYEHISELRYISLKLEKGVPSNNTRKENALEMSLHYLRVWSISLYRRDLAVNCLPSMQCCLNNA
jgi:hypothetical protein